ncbi:MAG: transposase [Magnetococcales bacterium]|nr:transposase [Magnetococcales bacterium]
MLVSLIVCLSKRMRSFRPRVQEFLHDWLGLWLGIGTINQCIHEAGRAVEPLEDRMIEEIRRAELLNVDETPWKEKALLLWFSVFCSLTITLFVVGARSAEALERILGNEFPGWLMSDGLKVYQRCLKRLRCWAHLDRKAKGLSESLDSEARRFGGQVLAIFEILRRAVYQAREAPPGTSNLRRVHGDLLGILMLACQEHADSSHEKTHALAREFLYDWEAIWAVLSDPFLPMTNNEAERLLRHWVIYRRICYDTRTAQGSRVVALLASVIETCRKRKVLPWPFLADTIAKRRRGEAVPPLPTVAAA